MRKGAAVFLTAAGLAAAAGCGQIAGGNEFAPVGNSIYISREGTVSSAFVEPCDQEYYTQEGLKAYLEKTMEEQYPDMAVTLRECAVENGTMKAVFDYGTPGDLVAFLEDQKSEDLDVTGLKVENLEDGVAEGSISGNGLINVSDGKTVDFGTLAGTEGTLVTVEGTASLQTEGKILYVSEGVEVTDQGAVTSGGSSYIIFK